MLCFVKLSSCIKHEGHVSSGHGSTHLNYKQLLTVYQPMLSSKYDTLIIEVSYIDDNVMMPGLLANPLIDLFVATACDYGNWDV